MVIKKRKPKVQTNVRLPDDLKARAEALAAEMGITLTDLVTIALRDKVDGLTPEEQAREIAKYLNVQMARR